MCPRGRLADGKMKGEERTNAEVAPAKLHEGGKALAKKCRMTALARRKCRMTALAREKCRMTALARRIRKCRMTALARKCRTTTAAMVKQEGGDCLASETEIKSTTANDATGKGDEGLANRRQVSWADEIPDGQLATKHVSARLRYEPGHSRCKRRAKPMSNDDGIKWRNDCRRRVRLRRVLKQVQEVDGMVTEV